MDSLLWISRRKYINRSKNLGKELHCQTLIIFQLSQTRRYITFGCCLYSCSQTREFRMWLGRGNYHCSPRQAIGISSSTSVMRVPAERKRPGRGARGSRLPRLCPGAHRPAAHRPHRAACKELRRRRPSGAGSLAAALVTPLLHPGSSLCRPDLLLLPLACLEHKALDFIPLLRLRLPLLPGVDSHGRVERHLQFAGPVVLAGSLHEELERHGAVRIVLACALLPGSLRREHRRGRRRRCRRSPNAGHLLHDSPELRLEIFIQLLLHNGAPDVDLFAIVVVHEDGAVAAIAICVFIHRLCGRLPRSVLASAATVVALGSAARALAAIVLTLCVGRASPVLLGSGSCAAVRPMQGLGRLLKR
mmetsp:Transcript_38854/g.91987  ORF Transcript_38854/g.91987 Transcript_38854/m.91987 type:complete len:361 (-) Transcript_38854:2737-3819(-)